MFKKLKSSMIKLAREDQSTTMVVGTSGGGNRNASAIAYTGSVTEPGGMGARSASQDFIKPDMMDQMIGKALNFGNQNKSSIKSRPPTKPFGKRFAGQLLGGKPPIQPRGRGLAQGQEDGGAESQGMGVGGFVGASGATLQGKKRASSAVPHQQQQAEDSFKYLDPDEDHLGANAQMTSLIEI